MIQITIRNFEVPWRFKNFSSLCLNFPLRNSNEAMQAHPLTTSGPAPFTVHAHHAAQTVIATTTRWLVSWQLALIWQCHLSVCLINIFSERKEGFSILFLLNHNDWFDKQLVWINLLTKRRLRMSGENVNRKLFLTSHKKLCLLKSLS